ncbi:MAG TPA: protein kinase [Burkholderiales bacterium]|nr:protein kinase [Burkholderiales bacterium]
MATKSTSNLKKAGQIGRFTITRELGKGAQGTVYLAQDTRLDRPVALKSLHIGAEAGETHARSIQVLLDEARIVSRLQHPNIVTLYDAVEENGVPHLVFEYVEGRTLSQTLRDKGAMSAAQAVRILIDVLRGIASAHAQQIVHRDLKPANIMLTTGGTVRVMDFGIARRLQGAAEGSDAHLIGTPGYMAPEYILGQAYTARCDLFSLGMILYELVVGAPAVQDPDYKKVLTRISAGTFLRPSLRNAAVDERLDGIIMQAVAIDPAQRYASAAQMSAALQDYLDPVSAKPDIEKAAKGKQATLDFLLRRMRHGSDFPALSSTISSVNEALSSENERASVLCNTILKDFALTNKLLKLVNAVHFTQFGGHVSTISRAVSILGYDGVRNVALSLVLLEHLQNKAQAASLKDEVVQTFFCGIMARQMVQKLGVRDGEHAFICSMFHRLGKLLAIFYLHEEAQAVERLREARGLDETRASTEVLGISFEELGIGVAREWKFPDVIVDSMRHIHEPLRNRQAFDHDPLRALAALSNDLCEVVAHVVEADRPAELRNLASKYPGLNLDETALQKLIAESTVEVAKDSMQIGIGGDKSRFLANAKEASGQHLPDEEELAPSDEPDTMDTIVLGNTLAEDASTATHGSIGETPARPTPEQRRGLLAAGVQDITNALVGDFELNDVLRIILETMYRAIGFTRVLLLVRDPRSNGLRARFGFGTHADEIVQKGFNVPLNGPRDIFFASISQGADLCIEDIDVEKIRSHVPQWFRELIQTRGLVLFPILVNHRPVALIYADTDTAGALQFSAEELNLLKTLRNQAVLAIKQKS